MFHCKVRVWVCVCVCVSVCAVSPENWPLMLKLHLKWRCDNLGERWNPLEGDQQYQDLDPYSRIAILHKLCHWRLELDDIADLLRVSCPTWGRGTCDGGWVEL